jgi:hypothetical protein
LNTHTEEQYAMLATENTRLRVAIHAMIAELREINRQNYLESGKIKSHIYDAIDLGQLAVEDEEFTDAQ